MIVHQVLQGTDAWLSLRLGIPTTSRFDDIITTGGKKGVPGDSSSAPKYMHHLLAERITGQPIEGFKSQYMERGSMLEERAVAAYELEHDCETEKVGFVTQDDGRIGCSPDRFIVGQDRGLLECKAPAPHTHVAYLLSATGAETEYKIQLQGQLWICEKDFVDICSFHPDMPLALFRVNRDDEFIRVMAEKVREFSYMLEEKVQLFTERGWIKLPDETVVTADDVGELGITDEDKEMHSGQTEGQ